MDTLLKPVFADTHVAALLKHHQEMVEKFQQGAWEECIVKAGKFVEAVLKALWVHTGNTLGPDREFKVDKVLNQLPNFATFVDSIRLTIPRACRFVYDVASNRGARHDPNEVDPNAMDATAVVAMNGWILGEMVRYAQKGSLKPEEAKDLVEALTEKKYALMEDVEGRTYLHVPGASGRAIALLLLWKQHPRRISRDALVAAVMRHGCTEKNAKISVERLKGVVDVDGGGLRLLQPGIREAEHLLDAARKAANSGKPAKRRRKRRATRGAQVIATVTV
jgi:hypothetical protein